MEVKKVTLKDIKKAKAKLSASIDNVDGALEKLNKKLDKQAPKKKKLERAESKINKAKVAKSVLTKPLQTQREIAKDTWVSLGTVNSKLNQLELEGGKDPRIQWIIDADLDIIITGQWIISERLQDEEEKKKISARDISTIIRENTARYTLFAWNTTDEKWGLNAPILELDTDKLLERLRVLNDKKMDNGE